MENNDEVFDLEEESQLTEPFNPEYISIEKKTVVVDAIVRRIMQGALILSPDFQRNAVWDDVRKSRLIESALLKIPLPMFYVSADQKNNYTVVDGLQRLSAIRDFVLGKEFLDKRDYKLKGHGLKLSGLEFWTSYNGSDFDSLPIYLQNRLLETEFTFTVINPGTPEDVKRNIFKRINTGGVSLTSQEIRNALYTGEATKLLRSVAESSVFINATGGSVKPDRMSDQELVLRGLSFILRSYNSYPKNDNMEQFLGDTMIIINSLPDLNSSDFLKLVKSGHVKGEDIQVTSRQELVQRLETGLSRSYELFGEHTFRRSSANERRTSINKALFETWTSCLSSLSAEEYMTLKKNRSKWIESYKNLLNDVTFQNAISRYSVRMTSVNSRFSSIQNIIQQKYD